MHIISGRLGGREFQSPPGSRTHPMSEKIRGAIFNALGDIEGLDVLDAYAGSGALAFEALSRGARDAQLVEQDNAACQTIRANAKQLRLEKQVNLDQANIATWLASHSQRRYDVIFCDPPYDDVQRDKFDGLADLLSPLGVFVLSLPPTEKSPELAGLQLLKRKTYGDATISFYKKAVQE